MSEETMDHMFEMFYQGDESHQKDGSGLGLAIVKRIVELHGGSVSAVSSPGAGSVFTVKLPSEKKPAAGSEGKRRDRRNSGGQGGRRARRPHSDHKENPGEEN
jgi:K+-sensing histidine kinase KdpD